MNICDANETHISAIQQIYAQHVTYGSATFETEPPSEAELLSRLEKTRTAGLIWLVALHENQVMGYCYLARYRERYAYRYTLEDSIYIDPNFQNRGVGKTLLQHAIVWAEKNGYRQLIAVVGNSENLASVNLHRSAGFTTIGTLGSVGLKHGRWLDTVLMQRSLGDGDSTLPEG